MQVPQTSTGPIPRENPRIRSGDPTAVPLPHTESAAAASSEDEAATASELYEMARPPTARPDTTYELCAVISHKGSVHSGHYISLVRDLATEKPRWVSLNDSTVKLADAEQVCATYGSNTQKEDSAVGVAYILMYVRQDVLQAARENVVPPPEHILSEIVTRNSDLRYNPFLSRC